MSGVSRLKPRMIFRWRSQPEKETTNKPRLNLGRSNLQSFCFGLQSNRSSDAVPLTAFWTYK